jgi:PAS domain S-box-containing protein
MGGSRVRAVADPVVETAGQRVPTAVAAVVEFAVGQLLGSDTSFGALPAVLEKLADTFHGTAALALQHTAGRLMVSLAAHPADAAADQELIALINELCAAHPKAAQAVFQAPLEPSRRTGQRRSVLVAHSVPVAGQCLCAVALVGDVERWDVAARSATRAVAAMLAVQIRHANDMSHLAERQAFTRALIDGSPDPIVTLDAQLHIMQFNPAAEALFGRSRDDVLGADVPGLLIPEPDRPEFIRVARACLREAGRNAAAPMMRARALHTDGTMRTVDLTPVPLRVEGETYLCGFIHDLSELERASAALAQEEARFRHLSRLAPVGILQTDAKGQCIFVNDRWCELTGMSAEEARGGGWARSIHPDDIQHVEAEWTRASAEGREFQVDCRLRQSHGGPRWVNAATIPLPGADGQPSGYLATVTDITSRKRAESRREQLLADELRARREAEEAQRRLAEQNSRLRNLDELKTQFLATASHELRTPLTSIVAFAELIRGEEDGLTPDAEGFLDIIQRNAEKLIRLVGDLLMLSRLESGVIRLELAPVSIPEVAREAVLAASAVAAEKDVALEITAGDGPLVQADGHRLAQLLDNLISNAVKFTPAGGRVTVTASHDGAAWRIDVADSGIGIPPGERDQLFDRFFRASNARAATLPGTGLGLSVVKTITDLHGGRVAVTSTLGSGTTFSVYLPTGS